MIYNIILSKTRKELEKVNFAYEGELVVLSITDEKWIVRVKNNQELYLVEYYENGCKEIIDKIELLEKYGIYTYKYVLTSEKLLIRKDENSYKTIDKETFKIEKYKEQIIELLHKFRKIKNEEILKHAKDYLNLENIRLIGEKYNLKTNKNYTLILENFNSLKAKIDKVPDTCIYNNFSLENIELFNDDLIVTNLKEICYGNEYKDINDITNILEDYFAFEKEKDEHKIIFNFIDKIKILSENALKENYDDLVTKTINEFAKSAYYEKLKMIIDWL